MTNRQQSIYFDCRKFKLPFFLLLLTGLDPDMSPDELEEKARLITQVLELQNTLDGKYFVQNVFLSHFVFNFKPV